MEEETFRILSEAIEKLPTQMRAIMQLALEGKKNAEIAERLNVSPETVHTLKKWLIKASCIPYRLLLLPSVIYLKAHFFSIFSKKIFIDSPCFYFGLYYH